MDRVAIARPVAAQDEVRPLPFTSAEFAAIQIGMLDPLPRSAGWTRLIGRAFGFRIVNPLADPRLEMLRRASLSLRALPSLSAKDIAAIRAEGFTADQLASLTSLVDAQR